MAQCAKVEGMEDTYAKIVLDSISPNGDRLTTMEVKMHRFVLAEINTHRKFSRNSSSSRAIPLSKQVERVFENPAYPVSFPAEQAGMQGGEELHGVDAQLAKSLVEIIRLDILGTIAGYTDSLEQIYGDSYKEHSLHKSVLSRYLEPFMWQTMIVSSTEWDNFFSQRVSPLAQPELMQAAKAMQDALEDSIPQEVKWGKWHLPYIDDETYVAADKAGMSLEDVKKISVARCARVSYLTHDGKRDLSKDIDLYDKLMSANPKHYSPLEHVATPSHDPSLEANFDGWIQLRALESQNER